MDYSLGEYIALNFSDEGYRSYLRITRNKRKLDKLMSKRQGILKSNIPIKERDSLLDKNFKSVDSLIDRVRYDIDAAAKDSTDYKEDVKKYKKYTESLSNLGKSVSFIKKSANDSAVVSGDKKILDVTKIITDKLKDKK